MIDPASLQSLRAVDVHGSVVGAAAALGFTPSAISQQIKRLERQTGVSLLDRVGRGVVLTAQARQLVEDGARLLGELERLEAGLHRSAGTVAGHVRLTAFSTGMRGLVAPVAGSLLAAHPDLTLTLVEREPWDTIDLVATGQYEMGVIHTWGDVPIDVPDHLERVSVAADVADVIVPSDHRLAAHELVTPNELLDEGWIATPEGTICRQWLSRMWDGTGRRPRVAHESMEYASHIEMVRAGLGIALIPRLGRGELPGDLVALEVADPVPTREVEAVHRRTMADSPAVRAILEALAAAAVAASTAAASES